MDKGLRKKAIVNKHYGEFIGVKQVIKGIKYDDISEATGQPITVGDGEVLWDVSDDRDCSFFLLRYKRVEVPYLCFEALETSTISYIADDLDVSIQTSNNKEEWNNWDGSEKTLASGNKIYFRNTANTLSNQTKTFRFSISGRVIASGQVNSLINFKNAYEYCYKNLFYNCKGLIIAPTVSDKILPEGACNQMFSGCSNLEKGPEIKTTSFGAYACSFMFSDCTKLTSVKLHYTGNFTSMFNQWMSGVNTEGIIYYNGTDTKSGSSGIPTNWQVQKF